MKRILTTISILLFAQFASANMLCTFVAEPNNQMSQDFAGEMMQMNFNQSTVELYDGKTGDHIDSCVMPPTGNGVISIICDEYNQTHKYIERTHFQINSANGVGRVISSADGQIYMNIPVNCVNN